VSRKPNSVPRLRALRRFGEGNDHSSNPVIADGLQRPTRWLGRRAVCSGPSEPDPMATLFGLAPCGVLPATRVATGAVRSYRTFSPLPRAGRVWRPTPTTVGPGLQAGPIRGGIFSVPLILQVTLTGRYPAHCPAEFGLSSHLRPCGLRRTVVWLTATLW